MDAKKSTLGEVTQVVSLLVMINPGTGAISYWAEFFAKKKPEELLEGSLVKELRSGGFRVLVPVSGTTEELMKLAAFSRAACLNGIEVGLENVASAVHAAG